MKKKGKYNDSWRLELKTANLRNTEPHSELRGILMGDRVRDERKKSPIEVRRLERGRRMRKEKKGKQNNFK